MAGSASRCGLADRVYRWTIAKDRWPVTDAISCSEHPASANAVAASRRNPWMFNVSRSPLFGSAIASTWVSRFASMVCPSGGAGG